MTSKSFALGIFVSALMSLVFGAKEQALVPSPNGEFVFELADPEATAGFTEARVRSNKTEAIVWVSPEQAIAAHWAGSVKCLWSPDARKFALNYQAGGRYEVCQVYCWNGKSFVANSDLEKIISERLEAAKNKQLREVVARMPASVAKDERRAVMSGSFQRRIWDNCCARKWLDDKTLEVTAYSTRMVNAPGMEEESEELDAAKRFVFELGRKGDWNLIEEKDITVDEAEDHGP